MSSAHIETAAQDKPAQLAIQTSLHQQRRKRRAALAEESRRLLQNHRLLQLVQTAELIDIARRHIAAHQIAQQLLGQAQRLREAVNPVIVRPRHVLRQIIAEGLALLGNHIAAQNVIQEGVVVIVTPPS